MKKMMAPSFSKLGYSLVLLLLKSRTHSVDEEPVLVDSVLVEEEAGSSKRGVQEIGGKRGNPFEDGETSAGLQHEQCDHLLNEKTDDGRGPRNRSPVTGSKDESRLEQEQTDHSNSTVSEGGILW
jgi:hypothetical protein